MSALDDFSNEMYGKPFDELSPEEQDNVLNEGEKLAPSTGGASARSESSPVGQIAGKVAEKGIEYGAKEYVYNPIRDAIMGKGAEAAGSSLAAPVVTEVGRVGASQIGANVAKEAASQAGRFAASQLGSNAATAAASQAGQYAASQLAEQSAAQAMAQYGNFIGPSAATPGFSLSNFAPSLSSLGPQIMAAIILKSIMLMSKDRNKTKNAEEFKAARLANEGVKLPDNILSLDTNTREDLAPDFVGVDSNGNYVNNKFNNSRSEKDLDTEMIMRTGAPYDLFEGSPEAIRKVVDKGREIGAFREQYGQIQTYLTPELEAAAAANGVKLRKGRDQYSIALGDVNDNKNIYGGIGVADMPTTERQRAAGNFYSDGYAGGDRERSVFDQIREKRAEDGESPEAMARRLEESKQRSKEAAERLRKQYEERYNASLAEFGGSKLTPSVVTPEASQPTTPKPADVTQPQPQKEVAPDAPPAEEAQSLYRPMSDEDSSMLDLLNLPGKSFDDELKRNGKAAQIEAQIGRRAAEARRGRIGSRRQAP